MVTYMVTDSLVDEKVFCHGITQCTQWHLQEEPGNKSTRNIKSNNI